MANEKESWYVGILTADDTCASAIHLTKDEYKAVVKFLNQLDNRGYASCCIEDTAYENEEECRTRADKITDC